jgi:hypothetical protein
LGSTLLFIESTAIHPLYLWVISIITVSMVYAHRQDAVDAFPTLRPRFDSQNSQFRIFIVRRRTTKPLPCNVGESHSKEAFTVNSIALHFLPHDVARQNLYRTYRALYRANSCTTKTCFAAVSVAHTCMEGTITMIFTTQHGTKKKAEITIIYLVRIYNYFSSFFFCVELQLFLARYTPN